MSNIEFQQELLEIPTEVMDDDIKFDELVEDVCNKLDLLPIQISNKWVDSYYLFFALDGYKNTPFSSLVFVLCFKEIKEVFDSMPSLN